MKSEQIDEKAVFNVARQIDLPDAREAYLRQVCSGDDELVARVQSLLEAYEEHESFLESPATASSPTIDQPVIERAGDSIGPYKLLQQIGEGGMGVVYMAEQTEPVERRVALKIIKPGMDTRQVIARFEAERQALAMMDHPNIARVLDAGTTETGRPFFVMELVKGIPITRYCDDNHLTPRERLELFIPICQAIQHAHQKGIIHRDIKPTNVLVAEYDDKPVAKVIDFGVAKATDHRLTEKTMFTEFGQVLGTFEYMSPEQAKLNQWDVDTRSDIYSLGVLLYELLSGETPFESQRLRHAALDEILRVIREEDPLRPSLRLSTSESLPSIAANRRIEPRQLSQLVRGELDWIVMKSLEKDRTRRYATASKLAEDIGHYLNDEPVEACPPSTAYRLQKFARRNKPVIATVGAVATALVVGTGVATWQAVRATHERNRAVLAEATAEEQAQRASAEAEKAAAERDKANSVASLLSEMLSVVDPAKAKGQDYSVEQLLDEFSRSLDRRAQELSSQPDVERTLRLVIGKTYRDLEQTRKAEPHLERAVELSRQLYGEKHVEYPNALVELAENHLRVPWTDGIEAGRVFREALDAYESCGAYEQIVLARFWMMLTLRSQSRLVEARELSQETLRIADKYEVSDTPVVTGILHIASLVEHALGDEAAALKLANEALARCSENHQYIPGLAAWCWFSLGVINRDNGHTERAEACFAKALDDWRDSSDARLPPFEGRALVELAVLYEDSRKQNERQDLLKNYSEEFLAEAYTIAAHAEIHSLRNPERAIAYLASAMELIPDGGDANYLAWWSATDAHSPFRNSGECVQLAELAVQAEPEIADYWTTLGVAHYHSGQIEQTAEALNKAVELRGGANARDGFFLAMAHQKLGDSAAARRWFNDAVDWMKDNAPNDLQLQSFRDEAAAQLESPSEMQ